MDKNSKVLADLKLRDFNEFMQKGDDFFKIELLRPAKIWYGKALKLNVETERVNSRLNQCNVLLDFELKVVKILCVIVVIIITTCILLFK
jgi:hypothetical protein